MFKFWQRDKRKEDLKEAIKEASSSDNPDFKKVEEAKEALEEIRDAIALDEELEQQTDWEEIENQLRTAEIEENVKKSWGVDMSIPVKRKFLQSDFLEFIDVVESRVFSVSYVGFKDSVYTFNISTKDNYNVYLHYSDVKDDLCFSFDSGVLLSDFDSSGVLLGLGDSIELLGSYDSEFLFILVDRIKGLIDLESQKVRADLSILGLENSEHHFKAFDKVLDDYEYFKEVEVTDWDDVKCQTYTYTANSRFVDEEAFKRDKAKHEQEILDWEISLTEDKREILNTLKALMIGASVLGERVKMFDNYFLKRNSKSKNLATRVKVTGQLYNLKDSQGNFYKFKFFKGSGATNLKSTGLDFEKTKTKIYKSVGSDYVKVTSLYGSPQLSKIESLKNDLADYFGLPVSMLSFYSEKGSVYISFGGSGSSLPEKIEARKDCFQKGFFTLGYDENGEPVRVGLYDLGHTLIGGMSGSGKSSMQNMLIASLYNSIEYVEHMFLVDFKRGVEFAPFLKVEGNKQTVVKTVEDFARLAGKLVALMNKRLDEMEQKGIREHDGKAVYVFLDEYAIIENQKALMPKEQYAEIQSSINTLMQMSRAAKIYLIFGVQKATDKQLPTFIKGQAKSRFLFRVDEATTASNVMGSSWSSSGINATGLPVGAFAFRLNGVYKVLKSAFISDDVLPSFLSFCSSQVASANSSNEHACEHKEN